MEDEIVVLEGLEAVRKRPAMYIGDVHDGSGLHHVLWSLVACALDEQLDGRGSRIRVSVADDIAEIDSDGRGLPVGVHPRWNRPSLEVMLTGVRVDIEWDDNRYVGYSPRHWGFDLAVVNALSEELEVEIRREGYVWRQQYSRGRPLGPLERGERTERTGTRIRIRADRTIFTSTRFDRGRVRERLHELAFFNPHLTFESSSEVIREPRGLTGWIETMAAAHGTSADEVFTTGGIDDGGTYEVALAWTKAPATEVRSFVGQTETPGGGTHERGFYEGIVRALATLRPNAGKPPRTSRVVPRLTPGLLAVVHVTRLDPVFGGAARERLVCREARRVVRDRLAESLARWLAERPALTRELLARIA